MYFLGVELEENMKVSIYSCHCLQCLLLFYGVKSELFVVTTKVPFGLLSTSITSLTSYLSPNLPLTSKNKLCLGSLSGLCQCCNPPSHLADSSLPFRFQLGCSFFRWPNLTPPWWREGFLFGVTVATSACHRDSSSEFNCLFTYIPFPFYYFFFLFSFSSFFFISLSFSFFILMCSRTKSKHHG